MDLNECEHFLKANWDRSKIDLNECEHFLKANWDRSQIDSTLTTSVAAPASLYIRKSSAVFSYVMSCSKVADIEKPKFLPTHISFKSSEFQQLSSVFYQWKRPISEFSFNMFGYVHLYFL